MPKDVQLPMANVYKFTRLNFTGFVPKQMIGLMETLTKQIKLFSM